MDMYIIKASEMVNVMLNRNKRELKIQRSIAYQLWRLAEMNRIELSVNFGNVSYNDAWYRYANERFLMWGIRTDAD